MKNLKIVLIPYAETIHITGKYSTNVDREEAKRLAEELADYFWQNTSSPFFVMFYEKLKDMWEHPNGR